MCLQPRGYQVDAVEAVEAHFATAPSKGALVVSATGTGKTVLAHLVAIPRLEAGQRGLWLAHRSELVEQASAALKLWAPELHKQSSIMMPGYPNAPAAQMVYASKDTLRQPKRIAEYLTHGYPDFIVVDECHHSPSITWKKLLSEIVGPNTRVLGLTATPDRGDTANISDQWELVYSFGILDGIACGALVPPYAAVDLIPGLVAEMALVTVTKGGEYNMEETEDVLLRNHVIRKTVEAVKKHHAFTRIPLLEETVTHCVAGMAGIVFTVTVNQAELTAKALNDAGFRARYVWGDMPNKERKRVIDLFRTGDIDILVNAGILTEGTDLPRAKFAVLARPTRSWTLFVQIVGRILRPFEGHERAYLIDLCGASQEHSIVAAPVLVDGLDCDESHDGRHRYLPIEGCGMGRCKDCGHLIKCIGNGGSHAFPPRAKEGKVQKDPVCKFCGETQCALSPDKMHGWVSWESAQKKCVHCAMTIPDPMSSLVDRSVKVKEEVYWKELYNLPAEVKAVTLEKFGILFNVIHKDGQRPFLFARDTLMPLSPRSVTPEMARLLTDDVVRRTQKKKGAYGVAESSAAMRTNCIRAEHLARTLRIWEV